MEIKYRIELPKLMKELGLPLTAIEIGVAEGFSSKDFLDNGLELLYSVDAWKTLNQKGDGGYDQEWHDKNYADAVARLSKFKEKSIIVKGLSHEVASNFDDESVGMLYLDGDHSYEGVKRDLQNYYPKVIKGGVIAGHDFLNSAYGVNQAVIEFTNSIGAKVYTIPENKTDDAGFYFIKP